MATFELWNMASGNLVGAFATEAEALNAVEEAVMRHGQPYGEALALGRENSRGSSTIVASGRQLIERAHRPHPAGSRHQPASDTRIA